MQSVGAGRKEPTSISVWEKAAMPCLGVGEGSYAVFGCGWIQLCRVCVWVDAAMPCLCVGGGSYAVFGGVRR